MYDKDEERRRRELEALKAKEAKLRAELASLNKDKQSAKSRLLSTTRHENWHVRRLAALDMLMGYVGEMASARIYVRSLPLDDYVAALRPFAVLMPGADNLSIEIAAVKANHDEWHRLGEDTDIGGAFGADTIPQAAVAGEVMVAGQQPPGTGIALHP